MFGYWIKITTSFAFLVASISDLKTKEVPDYLSGFLISLGLILPWASVIYTGSMVPLIKAYALGGVAFGFGYLMLKTAQWGGGDAKLITGSALLFSQLETGVSFFITFILLLFVVGATIGIAYLALIAIRNRKEFIKRLKKQKEKFYLFIVGSVILALLPFLMFGFKIDLMFWILAILFLLILPLKILEDYGLTEKRAVKDLVEGDWVIEEVKNNGETIFSQKDRAYIKEDEIKKLKELGIEKVEVKRGLPFIPSFLIAFLLNLGLSKLLLGFLMVRAF